MNSYRLDPHSTNNVSCFCNPHTDVYFTVEPLCIKRYSEDGVKTLVTRVPENDDDPTHQKIDVDFLDSISIHEHGVMLHHSQIPDPDECCYEDVGRPEEYDFFEHFDTYEGEWICEKNGYNGYDWTSAGKCILKKLVNCGVQGDATVMCEDPPEWMVKLNLENMRKAVDYVICLSEHHVKTLKKRGSEEYLVVDGHTNHRISETGVVTTPYVAGRDKIYTWCFDPYTAPDGDVFDVVHVRSSDPMHVSVRYANGLAPQWVIDLDIKNRRRSIAVRVAIRKIDNPISRALERSKNLVQEFTTSTVYENRRILSEALSAVQ